MREDDRQPTSMFSYVSAEDRVPADHPLRPIRALVDEILATCRVTSMASTPAAAVRRLDSAGRLLCAQLLQLFSSIPSERLLMEQLDYNVSVLRGPRDGRADLGPDRVHQEPRLLVEPGRSATVPDAFVDRAAAWMCDEHFTVDGTLIEAWASHKSFQRKDGPPTATAATFMARPAAMTSSRRTPTGDARLYRKSLQSEARLAYLGHVLMDLGRLKSGTDVSRSVLYSFFRLRSRARLPCPSRLQ